MTQATHISRRRLLTAVPLVGVMSALPAHSATQTEIGRGFVQWQEMKDTLDNMELELDGENAVYTSWRELQLKLLAMPCQSVSDLAAKVMMDTHLGVFELSSELLHEMHGLSDARLTLWCA